MNNRKRFFLFAPALILFLSAALQARAAQPEMADVMRQSGKIYVVVASLLLLVLGLAGFLLVLERRIGRLEKKSGNPV